MENIETLNRKVKGIKKYSLLEGIFESGLKGFPYAVSASFLASGVYALATSSPVVALASFAVSSLTLAPFLYKYNRKIEYQAGLVENKPKEEFFIHMGYEIKEHHKEGAGVDASTHGNIIKPLLINAEDWCKHGVIMGSTGSGKTVFLQFILKQIIAQGGGGAMINGKGVMDMKQEIYSIMCENGREQDFYDIDLNNIEKSMAISIFEMNSEAVREIFNVMLGENGKDSWGQKGQQLMDAMIKLFMVLKKNGLVFPATECESIQSLEDLLAIQYKFTMNFRTIYSYMGSKPLLDLLKVFKRLYKSDEGREYFDKITGMDKNEWMAYEEIHEALKSFLVSESDIPYEDLTGMDFKELKSENEDPFYPIKVAIGFWNNILDKFSRTYGSIFDSTSPSVDINDIFRGHKFLYFSLAGTKSDNELSLLGKMIIAIIKSAYENIQQGSPEEIPFTIFSDEWNSYSKGLEGTANLTSQTRSSRLAFYFLFQSSLDSMDDGKGLEGGQILANANTKVILKIEDDRLIKALVEEFGKKEYIEDLSGYQKRDIYDNNDKFSLEQNLSSKEEDIIIPKKIKGLRPGQAFIKVGAEAFKGIGGYFEPSRYEPTKKDIYLPHELRFPKEKFLKQLEENLNTKESAISIL